MKTLKKGDKEVELGRFKAALYHNLSPNIKQGYFSRYKLEDGYMDKFKTALDSYINKLDSGEYTIDDNGRIVDSAGQLDPYDNLNQQVAHYINFAFDNSPAYIDPEAAKKLKYSSESGISNALNQVLFNKESFNNDFLYQDQYDKNIKKRGHKERARMMSEALQKIRTNPDLYYSNLNDSNRTSIQSSIDNLINRLADGDLSEQDRMYATNLGIDPDLYLYTGEKYASDNEIEEPTDDQQEIDDLDKLVYEDLKTQQEEQKRAAMAGYNIYKQYRNLPNSGVTYTIGSSTDSLNKYYNGIRQPRQQIGDTLKLLFDQRANPNSPIYTFQQKMNADSNYIYNILKDPALLDSQYDQTPFLGRRWTLTNKSTNQQRRMFNGMTNREVLSLLLSNLTTGGQSNYSPVIYQNESGVNEAVIGTGSKSGYILTYNPNTGQISERRVADLPIDQQGRINKQLGTYLQYRQARTTPQEKNGGIIKAQFGAKLSHEGPSYNDVIKDKKKDQIEKELKQADGRDLKQYKAGQRTIQSLDDFTAVEWTRLGTAAADVVGTVAAFAPGIGTAVSAVSGIASTAGNMTADIMDESVSKWDVFKNFTSNLALSAISLIPGGGFTKLGKTIKSIKHLIVPAISIAAATGILTNEDVIKSLQKAVVNPTNLTVDDWKNVGYGLSAIAGVSKIGAQAIKSKSFGKFRAKEVPTDEFKVETNSGKKYNIKGKDIDEINEVGKRDGWDAANKLFKAKIGATEDLPSVVSYKTKGLFKSKRSNLLKGENVTKSSMSPEDAHVANMRKIYNDSKVLNGKQDRSGIYKFLNTDYEVFVEGKSPIRWPNIPSFNFMSSREKAWRQNYRRNHPPTQNQPTPRNYIGLNYKHLNPKNTKIVDLKALAAKSPQAKQKIDNFIQINDKNRYNTNSFDKYLDKHNLPKPKDQLQGIIFKQVKDKSGKFRNVIYTFKDGGTLDRATNIVQNNKVRKCLIGASLVPTYFKDTKLGGWTPEMNSSAWKGNTSFHGSALDLSTVLSTNNAYINDYKARESDINSYFNTNYKEGLSNLEAFKASYENYNNDIRKLHNFWNTGGVTYKKEDGTYGTDATEVNTTHKKLYPSRNTAENKDYGLNYQDNLQHIAGSTTWHRRWDFSDKLFADADDNEKRERIFPVPLADGSKAYVYKENDGTIGLLDNAEAERLLNYQEPILEQVQSSYVEGQNNLEEKPQDEIDVSKINEWNFLNKSSRLARLLAGYRTNRINRNDLIEAYSRPALLQPKLWQSPVYEGYSELRRGANEAANVERIVRDTQLSDPSLITSAQLEGALKAAAIREKAAAESDKINLASRQEAKMRDEKSMENRVDTNNTNRQILQKAKEQLAQVQNDYHTRQYEMLSNYLVEQENQRNQDISDLRRQALSTAEGISKLNTEFKTKVAYNQYMDAYSRDPNSEETRIAYDKYLKEVNNATIEAFNLTNNTVARVMGWPGYTYRNPETIFYQP